ncbi:MAG: hypothetical protein E6I78_14010, partial [Chloroflexi bacterium]
MSRATSSVPMASVFATSRTGSEAAKIPGSRWGVRRSHCLRSRNQQNQIGPAAAKALVASPHPDPPPRAGEGVKVSRMDAQPGRLAQAGKWYLQAVDAIPADGWTGPTRCADWTVSNLIAHV